MPLLGRGGDESRDGAQKVLLKRMVMPESNDRRYLELASAKYDLHTNALEESYFRVIPSLSIWKSLMTSFSKQLLGDNHFELSNRFVRSFSCRRRLKKEKEEGSQLTPWLQLGRA